MNILKYCASICFGLLLAIALGRPAAALDPGFHRWLQDLWPDAQALGVSRRTFEEATRGVEPDLTLPDLDVPGREGAPPRGQAEFVQTPADYIKESTITHTTNRERFRSGSFDATRDIEMWEGGRGDLLRVFHIVTFDLIWRRKGNP